jgi:hypothetical protein
MDSFMVLSAGYRGVPDSLMSAEAVGMDLLSHLSSAEAVGMDLLNQPSMVWLVLWTASSVTRRRLVGANAPRGKVPE